MTRAAPPPRRHSGRWRLGGAVGWDGVPETTGDLILTVEDGHCTQLQPDRTAGGGPAGLVLVPLLVNGHDHGRGHGNVLAGIADAPLEDWLTGLRGAPRTTQAELVGAAGSEMLASGTGAAVLCINPQGDDIPSEVQAAVEAVVHTGLRAAVVYPIADAFGDRYGRSRDEAGWTAEETAGRLAEFERLARCLARTDIELQLGPIGPQWVSEATLRAVADHAHRHGRRIHMHLLESRAQRAWADRVYPEGVVAWLGANDLLGPHVCLAHGTHLRPGERAAIAASGAVVTVNVSSNLRLGSGIPPLADLLDGDGHGSGAAHEAAVACGLDGLALGDDHDNWNELRLLRGIYQGQSGRHPDAADFLGRLTDGGRRTLGAAAPQAPRPGETADFVLLDLSGYRHLWTERGWTLAEAVLAAARPGLVADVWVNGRSVHSPGLPAAANHARGDR